MTGFPAPETALEEQPQAPTVHRLSVVPVAPRRRPLAPNPEMGPTPNNSAAQAPQPPSPSPMAAPAPPPPKLDPKRLTPEQAIQAQLATLAVLQAIGLILGTRLLLFIAVGIGAALAFFVKDAFSAGVFAAWVGVVLPLLVALDYFGRKNPGAGS